jgi:GAF domain-containing protein
LLAVPVEAPGGLGGLAVVFFQEPRRFSDYDLELARNLAGTARGALERSELYESERRARGLAQQLARTGSLLSTELDPAAVLDEIVGQAPVLLVADAAVVRMLDDEHLVVSAARGDLPEGILGSASPATGWAAADAIQTRGPIAIGNVEAEGSSKADRALEAGHKALLAVPLGSPEGGPQGVLSVYSQRPRSWRPEEIEALAALAGNAAGRARKGAERRDPREYRRRYRRRRPRGERRPLERGRRADHGRQRRGRDRASAAPGAPADAGAGGRGRARDQDGCHRRPIAVDPAR